MKDKVNTIYVTAASAADIPAVQKEVSSLLPDTTIATASSLASQVTGSVASAAKLANDARQVRNICPCWQPDPRTWYGMIGFRWRHPVPGRVECSAVMFVITAI